MKNPTPADVVALMMKNDYYSQWLGIEILEVSDGCCRIRMTTRREMLNGFGIVHGGVTTAFADSALAFASNNHNRLSVALDISMSFPVAAKEGDTLIAEARELHLSNKVGIYQVTVSNQNQQIVGIFKGTVYRTTKLHIEP